jgi:hypothetical protein
MTESHSPPPVEDQGGFGSVWDSAVAEYEKITGKPLDRTNKWNNVTSIDELLTHIKGNNTSFKNMREKRKKIREVLEPVVDCVSTLNAVVKNTAKLVSAPDSPRCLFSMPIHVASISHQRKLSLRPSNCSARYLLARILCNSI